MIEMDQVDVSEWHVSDKVIFDQGQKVTVAEILDRGKPSTKAQKNGKKED